MRLWYLRRAVPWAALLGCLVGAAAMSGLTHRWPSVGWLGIPCVALLCAAAAAFVRDEPAVAVVSVTPRGGIWAPSLRSSAVLLPLAVSLVLLVSLPTELHPDRAGLAVLGTASVLLALGASSLAAAGQRPRPGGAIASAAVLLGLAPLPVSLVLDADPLFPIGTFPDGIRAFWVVAGAIGLVACLVVPVLSGGPLRLRRTPARRPAPGSPSP